MRGKDYRPPGILAGTQWPGLETLYDSTYQLARLRPRASIEHLTTSDFLHAYLSDPEQALSQLQEKCLFANQLSGVRFQVADSEDQTMSETEQVDSESSFSRLSEIPTTGFDESWSKNTSKRRTISLLKGFAELSFASEPSEPLEPTLNSFVSATDSVCDAENRISVVSVEEAPHETSSIIEEGSMGVGMRMFLTGTASHNCFSLQPLKFVKLQQKVLSPLVTPHLTSTSLSFLGEAGGDFDQSPLIRKLIVCEKRLTQESIVELKLGLVCTGYQLALPLEFSNIENSSRAGVRYTANNDFAGLMYSLCLEVMLQHQVVSMASGHEHCVAVTTSGQVLTWGNGQSGCLGHGDRISRIEPTIVDGLRSVCVVAADCGAYHTAAVTLDGGLWTWGRGDAGQLGLAAARLEKDSIGVLSLAPAPVTYFTRKNMKVRAIACGEAHLLAVDRSGVVHACGWSEDGQTGLAPANPTNTKCPFGTAFRVDNDAVVKVSAGSLHSCALTGLGRLYVWGNGSQGQLGLGSKVTSTRTPTLISFLEQQTIIDVVCGDSSVLCLTDAFKVYGWGQGIAGHFGNRSASDDLSAKFPEGTEVICLQPRTIGEVDPVHRIIAGSSSGSLVWAAQTERAVRTGWMQDSEFKDTSSEV